MPHVPDEIADRVRSGEAVSIDVVYSKSGVLANVEQWGTGALNIDACRVAHANGRDQRESERKNQHALFANPGSNADSWSGGFPPRTNYDGSLGRWPANVVLDEAAAAALDDTVGVRASGNHPAKRRGIGYTEAAGGTNSGTAGERRATDAGGPSRFYYCPKPSQRERSAGLDGLKARTPHPPEPNGRVWDIPGSRSQARANHHPTVKPVALCRWLIRMVTPPAGVVCDPFMGSGTTGIACVLEGRSFVGIEREAEYLEIAEKRIEHRWGPLFSDVVVEAER